MTYQQFFIQLAIVTSLLCLLLFLLGTLLEQNTFDNLSIGSIAFFILLCSFLFWWGKQAAKDPNPNVFSRMALASIGIKMFLAVFIVVSYVKIVAPESNYFLLSFLTIYFSYTIFETYFLSRLGRELPEKKPLVKDEK